MAQVAGTIFACGLRMVRRVVELWEWFGPSVGPIPISGEQARAVARSALRHLPAALLVALFLITGLRGIDFGFHWDEAEGMIRPARGMLESGILLPRSAPYSYNYPGLTRFMVLWPAFPAGVRAAVDTGLDPGRIQAAMLGVIDAPGFVLSLRRMFLVTSSLGVLWLYCAALAFGLRWWTALVAAAGLGLSWEFAYHARFVATDCVLVQFSALSVFMLALHHRTGRFTWLSLAAAAAGLATGTKYTGAVLLIPVVLAAVLEARAQRPLARITRVVRLCGMAFGAFLLTTPGVLLDPFRFIADARFISTYYATGHAGYSVASAPAHAKIALEFLALDYFSPFRALSLVAFAGALAGAVVWLRRDHRVGVVLVAVPLAFLTYFCLRYRLVVVRNYLFIAPFLALLLARAVEELAARASRPVARAVLPLALVGAAAVQGAWLVRAGESVRNVSPKRYVREAFAYVAEHPRTRFRLSGRVQWLAAEQRLVIPQNVVPNGAVDEVVFFASMEGPGPWKWTTNDPWLTRAVFGPREVNLNWYSSWAGHDRVVVMTFRKAKAVGIPLAG